MYKAQTTQKLAQNCISRQAVAQNQPDTVQNEENWLTGAVCTTPVNLISAFFALFSVQRSL